LKYGSPAVKLIEECSEVIDVCCKIERFGLDDFDPNQPKKLNRARLEEELSDIEEAIKTMRLWVASVVSPQVFRVEG